MVAVWGTRGASRGPATLCIRAMPGSADTAPRRTLKGRSAKSMVMNLNKTSWARMKQNKKIAKTKFKNVGEVEGLVQLD